MASALDSTYGIWLISIFLETILYGMGILQAWLYFHWYSKDHWGVKATVLLVVVLETLQITFFFRATYYCLIEHFGDFPELSVVLWEDSAQLITGYLSAFVVQMYFAYCIFILDKNKATALLIAALALTQIGAGIAQTILAQGLGLFSKLDQTKAITTLQSGATLACDIVITVTLCITLSQRRTGVTSTNSMLNMLMMYAVNRGVFTAVCAALNMILFLALPGTFYFFVGLMLSSKMYMNSMLATLNTRQHIRSQAFSNSQDWHSFPMETSPNAAMAREGVRGSIAAIDLADSSSQASDRPPCLGSWLLVYWIAYDMILLLCSVQFT